MSGAHSGLRRWLSMPFIALGVAQLTRVTLTASSKLKLGVNTGTFAFMDKCGGVEGRWETWLTLP
jgi:hypothetical protein